MGKQFSMSQVQSPSASLSPPVAPMQEAIQPIFRVMRLYKPSMYIAPTEPTLESCVRREEIGRRDLTSDFAILPYLLLPDSFGDIYIGETFSAYISVVNGIQDNPFYQVVLSIRLQTTNANYDLTDIRPNPGHMSGSAKVLNSNESTDVVVSHVLSELGTHTLRASVQFLVSRNSEPTTLRKIYRFNVLQPLNIVSSCSELGNKIMVQCQVTNVTKSPVYLEEISFNTSIKDAQVIEIGKYSKRSQQKAHLALNDSMGGWGGVESDVSNAFLDLDAMQLLNVNESYSYAFIVVKPPDMLQAALRTVGSPVVRWSSALGEHGAVTGDDVLYNSSRNGLSVPSSSSSSTSSSSSSSSGNPSASAMSTSSSSGGSSSGGVGAGNALQMQSLASNNPTVRFACVCAPAQACVGEEFDVLIRITNTTHQAMALQLQHKDHGHINNNNHSTDDGTSSSHTSPNNHYNGLCVTGLATANLGILAPNESVERTITVCPLSGGLHDLRGLVAVDMSTFKEFACGSLFKVFVYDSILHSKNMAE